ncbi:hypothetical protein LTV02_31865 [Nocardia yamanashiensis]|uniref:hypothetical protein n=1 Tax=Nocardia yamanashiensis TaxID=209247 RepID=UPI001E4C59D6|nr:hypothetical protein [Nocardia yamanashiensis]UGT40556.1 hypothetical protein LTV02_31865 [Nocardia yamanashiensis]
MTSSNPLENAVWEIRELRRRAATQLGNQDLPAALTAIERANEKAAELMRSIQPGDKRAGTLRRLARFTELEHAAIAALSADDPEQLERLMNAIRELEAGAVGTRTIPGDIGRSVLALRACIHGNTSITGQCRRPPCP